MFARVKNVIELPHVDVKCHFAEHLDKAAVTIVGEARVAADLGQAFHSLIVQAKVENGVHHARHGELRTGAHAEKQRIGWIAQLLVDLRFQIRDRLRDLLFDLFGDRVLVLEIDIADFGRNSESRGDRDAGLAHLGQA